MAAQPALEPGARCAAEACWTRCQSKERLQQPGPEQPAGVEPTAGATPPPPLPPVWRLFPWQGLVLRLWFRSFTVVLLTFLAILMPFFGSIIGLSGALSECTTAPAGCRAAQPREAWLVYHLYAQGRRQSRPACHIVPRPLRGFTAPSAAVQPASTGFWPVTVAGPIMCFIKVHHPPARTQAWLHALSVATLIVTLAACVGAVYDVIDGWSTFGFFNGGG